jgi:NADPH:quinone reductase-like Zn-dependent oxidoreductase
LFVSVCFTFDLNIYAMKAFTLNKTGDTSHSEIQLLNIPEINADEVLIKVKAMSINPVDVKTRQGYGLYSRLKDLNPIVLGWDVAGVVEMVGASASPFKVGDEVFGMVNFPGNGRTFAEYVAAPASQLAIKPLNISFEEAAASALAALTAYQVLVKKAKIQRFQKVLISAASGGVGHFAAQLAKYLDAYVIGTSSEKNRGFVLGLGVDEHVDYTGDALETKVGHVDFAFDAVGGNNIERLLPLVKKGGSFISIAAAPSEYAKSFAATFGINIQFVLVESSGEDMKVIAELLSRGKLKPFISKVFTFEQMGDAHLAVETGRTVGKVVVTI